MEGLRCTSGQEMKSDAQQDLISLRLILAGGLTKWQTDNLSYILTKLTDKMAHILKIICIFALSKCHFRNMSECHNRIDPDMIYLDISLRL